MTKNPLDYLDNFENFDFSIPEVIKVTLNNKEYPVTDITDVLWQGTRTYRGMVRANKWVVQFRDETAISVDPKELEDGTYEVLLAVVYPD